MKAYIDTHLKVIKGVKEQVAHVAKEQRRKTEQRNKIEKRKKLNSRKKCLDIKILNRMKKLDRKKVRQTKIEQKKVVEKKRIKVDNLSKKKGDADEVVHLQSSNERMIKST